MLDRFAAACTNDKYFPEANRYLRFGYVGPAEPGTNTELRHNERMARSNILAKQAPERVTVFQELFSAPARVLVLRALLPKPLNYGELFDKLGDVMSRPAIHGALIDLRAMGYIEDDAPDGVIRRSSMTKLTARRDLVTHDFSQALEFVLG